MTLEYIWLKCFEIVSKVAKKSFNPRRKKVLRVRHSAQNIRAFSNGEAAGYDYDKRCEHVWYRQKSNAYRRMILRLNSD